MRLFTYLICFFTFCIFTAGILFKIMHWPGASVMLVFAYPAMLLSGLMLMLHKYNTSK